MSIRSILFGSFALQVHASLDLQQNYFPKHNRTYIQLQDGDEVQQKSFSGLIDAEITGKGIIPPGLHSLDFDNPMYVSFSKARRIRGVTTAIVLPTKRRSDAGSEPFAKALTQAGQVIDVSMSMAGDTANLVDPGVPVSEYFVYYFPKIYAWVEEPTEGGGRGNDFNWSIRVREKKNG